MLGGRVCLVSAECKVVKINLITIYKTEVIGYNGYEVRVMDLEEKIAELEAKIAVLPQGSIVSKIINGKKQPYLQWSAYGQSKSKYIKIAERETVFAQVEERKALQKQLKELRAQQEKSRATKGYGYEMLLQELISLRAMVAEQQAQYQQNSITDLKLLTGQSLEKLVYGVKQWKHRRCYKQLEAFLQNSVPDRVCILYGLRRTGKTTLLKQLIASLEKSEFAKAVYIKASAEADMAELNRTLKKLENAGYKYIFIDEITLLEDFIDGAAVLSDIYAACGMKIFLSGTDSLGFWLSSRDELYDRCTLVHTTFIPFYEYVELLGIKDVDAYIRYGGTLKLAAVGEHSEDTSFYDDESTRAYIDSAISRNIQHGLACCKDGKYFGQLEELYDANELTSAINRVLEDMTHRFLVKVLTDAFKSHDLGSAAELLRKDKSAGNYNDALDRIDKQLVTERLMQVLDIRNRLEMPVSSVHAAQLRSYLKALDLLVECHIERPNWGGKSQYDIFTQPGMRYSQAKALVEAVLTDDEFGSLPKVAREYACTKILEDVLGRMLEDIVLCETKKALTNDFEVFKLQLENGEFDMVIFDRRSFEVQLFEIKHSKEINSRQYRYLDNVELLKEIEAYYGKITRRCVLYKGASLVQASGIEYKNVEEYLLSLGLEQKC